VQELVEHGASVHTGRRDGATPLFRVAREGRVPVLHELVQLGADVKIPIVIGTMPLLAAAVNVRGRVVLDSIRSGAVVNNANVE
jgi:ankyrin repeat protein